MFDRDQAREQANKITSTGKAVGFPANLKVYTGGKAPGVEKWLVYARSFDTDSTVDSGWQYLSNAIEVDNYISEMG